MLKGMSIAGAGGTVLARGTISSGFVRPNDMDLVIYTR